MLGTNRHDLLADDQFREDHSITVDRPSTQQVMLRTLVDVTYELPRGAVVDPIQHGAMRDAFHQGVRAAIEYFMRFLDEPDLSDRMQDPVLEHGDEEIEGAM